MECPCPQTYRIMASSCTQTFRIMACTQTFRILCAVDDSLSLAVRNGEAVLATANPRDECQHWIKDTSYSDCVTDEEDQPAFTLVNIATGQALKHSLGRSRPVRLTLCNPDYLDESVLWTASKDGTTDLCYIRMVNNIDLVFNARDAGPEPGNAFDGTAVVLDSKDVQVDIQQQWKLVEYDFSIKPLKGVSKHPMRIFCRDNENVNVTIRGSKVVLAHANPNDEWQHWIKDFSNVGKLTDAEGHRVFALVNKATGQALSYSPGSTIPVQLAPYKQDSVDISLLWTESADISDGFRLIRVASNIGQVLNGLYGNVRDGTVVSLYTAETGDNSLWKVAPI